MSGKSPMHSSTGGSRLISRAVFTDGDWEEGLPGIGPEFWQTLELNQGLRPPSPVRSASFGNILPPALTCYRDCYRPPLEGADRSGLNDCHSRICSDNSFFSRSSVALSQRRRSSSSRASTNPARPELRSGLSRSPYPIFRLLLFRFANIAIDTTEVKTGIRPVDCTLLRPLDCSRAKVSLFRAATRMPALPVQCPEDLRCMGWREYHELTKHSVESLRRTQHYLDWANMPNPFRHYEGVPVLDLPADPPAPQISALEVLEGKTGNTLARDGAEFLSQLMFYSASISASKRVPSTGAVYALRVNPSSGNLHPTEFHICSQRLVGWPHGLYHYRPSSHMAEQRAIGEFARELVDISAPLIFVLTSIAWREAWKYGDRAYRYCMHDIGHAWQALTLAAQAIGCESFAFGHFSDDRVAEGCLLHEDEWPMLIVGLYGPSIPVRMLDPVETILFGGQPNRLSEKQEPYPLIERIHVATKLSTQATIPFLCQSKALGRGEINLPPLVSTSRSFGDVARARRSALDFRGGASRSPSRNLRLFSPPHKSASSPISPRLVSSACIFTSTASKA